MNGPLRRSHAANATVGACALAAGGLFWFLRTPALDAPDVARAVVEARDVDVEPFGEPLPSGVEPACRAELASESDDVESVDGEPIETDPRWQNAQINGFVRDLGALTDRELGQDMSCEGVIVTATTSLSGGHTILAGTQPGFVSVVWHSKSVRLVATARVVDDEDTLRDVHVRFERPAGHTVADWSGSVEEVRVGMEQLRKRMLTLADRQRSG